jgi:hypothetical protein
LVVRAVGRPLARGTAQGRIKCLNPGQPRALCPSLVKVDKMPTMKSMFLIVVWCLLFVLCWPLALAALVLWPLVWLLSLPFRLLSLDAVFALLKAILFLPARLLGGGGPAPSRR